ncbi:MAG: TAXI family TRAP transporter solute-binding subunit [Candidatus Competibacterales bacterium]|nr:TAXI family TRAP transporter solute-binding subunit [Candidatus Competibacterales bacterium]
MVKRRLIGLVAVLLVTVPALSAWAETLVIGTASRAGVYYQVGRTLCRLVEAGRADHGLSCEARTTDGSIANLRDLRSGALRLAVVQSDWQYHARNGSGPFAEAGPDENLRALFSLHGEPFTVVARNDAGIGTFDDLRGKRVNIGNPGSGQRATMEVVMAAMGWDTGVFVLTDELPADQQSLALCHDKVQAMVYTVGHPNPSVRQATDLCAARIIEVRNEAIDELVAERPYYAYTTVPGGMYPNNPDPVTTFGVKATVVASAELDADTVETLVETVFGQLDSFRQAHPAFANLAPERMIADGLSAPVHEGARRYYQAQGWVE